MPTHFPKHRFFLVTALCSFLTLIITLIFFAGVNAQTAASDEACSPSGSYGCASDGNSQFYCSPSTNKWQFSQYCSTSNRTCGNGMCQAICGDGICGIYETAADCPGSTDCGSPTPPPATTTCPDGSTVPVGTACPTQCTGLNLVLNDGKTTYAVGDMVNYTYTCTPGGSAANVTIQVVKPDGTATTYNFASNINTSTMGFGTTNLAAGNYTLRACFDSNCSPVTASVSFTVAAPPQCSSGAITSNCYCGGTSSDYLKSSGYCCHSYLSNGLVWTNVPCSQTCQSLGGVCCSGAASDCTGTWSNQWCTDCQGYVCCVGTCKGTIYGPGAPTTPTTPTAPTNEQTNCTTGGGKWCLNSDKVTGWCSYSSSACPAYDTASCTAQGGEWCTYTSGTGGWCATMGATCPINDQATCVAKGRSWCLSSSGGTSGGWCTATSAEKCPAYNETDCKAQNGEWCPATYSGGTGWCSTPPVATYAGATGSYGCPINDKTTCLAKNRNWCLPSGGGTGWCAMINEKCPAYDAASCTAQGSEWCTSTGGGTGWCATNIGGCPIYDKTTCFAKGRKWCTPSYGGTGWCTATTTDTCGSGATTESPPATPTPTPEIYPKTCPDGTKILSGTCSTTTTTTCPDGSTVPAGVSCPTVITDQAKCSGGGGKWCKDTTGTAGWCSYGVEPCPLTDKTSCTASGYEWCTSQATTNNTNFVWCDTSKKGCSATDKVACAAKGREWCPATYSGGMGWCANIGEKCLSYLPVPVPEEYTTCPDGTRVHGSCYNTCPDGSRVLHNTPCPENNSITICAQNGGIWCMDAKGGEKGYCSLTGKCFAVWQQPIPTTPMPIEGLDKQSIKKAEWQRDSIIRQLKNLAQNFKKLNDEESLQKILVLIDKAQTASMEANIFDYLQAIREEANILEEIYATLKAQGAEEMPEQYERDRQLEQRALNQMKKNIRSFEGRLTVVKKRIDVLQKQGVNVPSELKEALTRGLELIKAIRNTINYDEAQDAVQALQDASQIVNDYLPQLEQLARLPRVFSLVNSELKKQDAALKRLRASAERLKVDIDSLLTEFESKIAEIRSALASAKAGDFGDQEPFDYIQDNIGDKLNELIDSTATIQAIANLKQTVNTMSAKLTRYETKIKSLERKKQDMTEARAILDEAKAQLKALKGMTAAKLTDDDVFIIKDGLQMLYVASEQLDNLLRMAQPSLLERELQRKSTSGELFKLIPLPELEKLSLNATRLATFYKRPVSALAGYGTAIVSPVKQSWRTRFAWDQ